jgi:hypothetical protein
VPNLDLPAPGGDRGQWGYKNNAALQALNEVVENAATTIATKPSITDVTALVESDYVDAVRPERFGAVADGLTDATAAIQAALATGLTVVLSTGTYRISGTLAVGEGQVLRGQGGGSFGLGSVDAPTRLVVTSNTATTAVTVAEKGMIADFYIEPQNLAAVSFQAASYPAATGNCATGVSLADSAIARGVAVNGMATQGFLTSNRAKITACYAGRSDIGFSLAGPDGTIFDSVATFCHTAGMKATANYWRVVGCRLEWNARYGIHSAAEGTYIGNLFDRNGSAGLYLNDGSWGAVVTGNDFTRNGCGGNGTYGRWGASVPAHLSYVATAATDSCHIKMKFQRGVTVTGNRFRSGNDDANSGANAPLYIYSFDGSSGSTGSSNYFRSGNAGESGAVLGYVADNGTYSETEAIAGGTDTSAVTAANAGVRFNLPVSAPGFANTRDQAASASSIVITPVQNHGEILIRCTNSSVGLMAKVYFGRNSGSGTTRYAAVENKQGTPVSSATNNSDGTITVNFAASYFSNYTIVYV